MQEDASVQRSSLDSDPPGLTFTGLKPGDSVDKTVTVTNSAPYPVELSSQVTRDGFLFQGAHPLVVSFEVTPDPGTAAGGCAGLDDVLPADSTATVHVRADFPAAAGNEYQSQTGTATLFFTATAVTPGECGGGATGRPPLVAGTPPHLPATGVDVSGVILLAVALLVVGTLLRSAVRRWEARRARA